MAPFRNAVSLINSYPCQLPLLMHDFQVLSEVVRSDLLWRDIKQASKWVASLQVP